MENKQHPIDEIFKNNLSEIEFQVDEQAWQDFSSSEAFQSIVAVKKTRSIYRIASYFAAAAAVITAGLIVFHNTQNSNLSVHENDEDTPSITINKNQQPSKTNANEKLLLPTKPSPSLTIASNQTKGKSNEKKLEQILNKSDKKSLLKQKKIKNSIEKSSEKLVREFLSDADYQQKRYYIDEISTNLGSPSILSLSPISSSGINAEPSSLLSLLSVFPNEGGAIAYQDGFNAHFKFSAFNPVEGIGPNATAVAINDSYKKISYGIGYGFLETGLTKTHQLSLSVARKVKINKNWSFAPYTAISINQQNNKLSDIGINTPDDQVFTTSNRIYYPSLSAGLMFANKGFKTSLQVENLNKPNTAFVGTYSTPINYSVVSHYTKIYKEKYLLQPIIAANYFNNLLILNAGFNVGYNEKLILGVSGNNLGILSGMLSGKLSNSYRWVLKAGLPINTNTELNKVNYIEFGLHFNKPQKKK